MQPLVFEFVKKHAQQGRVLDIGSLDVNGNVRELFPESEYIGLDMRAGDNVDMVANSHNLPYDDESFDMVVCLEMLEHDDDPFKTASEIRRVVKQDGHIIVCASGIEMHKHEHPADFWRFTAEAFLLLFKGFKPIENIEGRREVLFAGVKTENDLPVIQPAVVQPLSAINRKVSIIIPVVRPEGAERCVNAIRENAGIKSDQYEILSLEDTDGIGCPAMVKQLTMFTLHDLVMFLGDDTVPEPGFLEAALRAMDRLPDRWGVVGLNTKGPMFGFASEENIPKNRNPIAHWMADKRMLEYIPGGDFFPIDYKHCMCDVELYDIARELGRWVFAEDSKIDHKHPINQSGEWDDLLENAYSDENRKHDLKTYLSRKIDRMRSRSYTGIKLAIAYPVTYEIVYAPFCFTNLNIVCQYIVESARNNRGVPSIDILTPHYAGNHDAVRNNLVGQALRLGCTHVLMMDTDQVYYTPDLIQRLLDHNKPVVGARVHRRYPPFDPILIKQDGEKYHHMDYEEIDRIVSNGETIEVPATGCGCILYDTKVFVDIDPPWFKHTKTAAGRSKGEDIYFCEQLKRSGFKIFVDTSIDINHLTLMEVGMSTYRLYQKLYEKQKEKTEEVHHGKPK